MRQNAWRVIFFKDNKRRRKTFEGDAPRPAIDYAKRLQKAGFRPEVHSVRRAFAPPLSKRNGPAGSLWCPYCLKWREFKRFGVSALDGTYYPEDLRCPICFITTNSYYVKKFNFGNPVLYHEEVQEVKLRVSRDSPASKARTRRIRRGRN